MNANEHTTFGTRDRKSPFLKNSLTCLEAHLCYRASMQLSLESLVKGDKILYILFWILLMVGSGEALQYFWNIVAETTDVS